MISGMCLAQAGCAERAKGAKISVFSRVESGENWPKLTDRISSSSFRRPGGGGGGAIFIPAPPPPPPTQHTHTHTHRAGPRCHTTGSKSVHGCAHAPWPCLLCSKGAVLHRGPGLERASPVPEERPASTGWCCSTQANGLIQWLDLPLSSFAFLTLTFCTNEVASTLSRTQRMWGAGRRV